ncbi:MAG: septal ring lytic transglycosylase RlpA family protein [Burkholderiaceae bacterium]|nr:septal ring lytic transglycosylase RlpA family protein [Rhodoferax sp.]MCP5285082.1 septal ring lytic transglycosylase RlpA family protein [Burkholderiaceae bacterium]
MAAWVHRRDATRLGPALLGFLLLILLLGGCASRAPAVWSGRDGAAAQTPADLERTPDAVPRIEPLRVGGPNKPYEVRGVRYVPMTEDLPLRERGLASWYGRKFHGRPTSNGETYDMFAMTAAHKTMPLPSYARVRNPANGREIIVRVNDRGPFHEGRVIDLSYTAALKLGVLGGVAPVEVERITFDQIRDGLRPTPNAPTAPFDATGGSATDATDTGGPGFWLQLGAFRDREGALQLQRLLLRETPWLADQLTLQDDGQWVRVRVGPWARRDEADAAAARLADALPLQALVVRVP